MSKRHKGIRANEHRFWKGNPAMTTTMTRTIDPLLMPARRASGQVSQSRTRVRRASERTYRRRRRVVGVAVMFGVITAVVGTGAVASDPAHGEISPPHTVVAQRGDTLWDIARTIVPEGPIGDLVTDMVRLNGSQIEPGQVIRIP
jgi:nucleoid-associated protein YgaU